MADAELELPRAFGEYVLVRELGVSADDDFFVAVPRQGRRRVVVIRRGRAEVTGAAARAALDGVRTLAQLCHPNLVRIIDGGVAEGRRFLASELVEGKDLRAIWTRCAERRRRIPVAFALYVAREAACGLAYAHGALGFGLAHGEMTPAKVLVGYDGAVRLTDFSPARASREITGPAMLMGRLSYLSPEEARGEAPDASADLYALAVILWEMLTGRQLLGSSLRSPSSAIAAARNPHIRPPSALVQDLPEGTDEAVLAGLTIAKERRCPSAERFRARLGELLARAFPGYDAGQAGAWMRELFADEAPGEAQALAGILQENFSSIRGEDPRGEGAGDDARARGSSPATELGAEATPGAGMGNEDAEALAPREIAERRRGTVVAGHYRIEDLLSFDGMGALYRARDLTVGKPCALRVLPESYSRDPELSSGFMRDAQAATGLGHPNVIEVLAVGRLDDGSVYSAMELLDGQSIAAILGDELRLSPSRAVHVATQICRALGTAHENGIIHRDLKPESVVLIAHEGDLDFVKVVDFGICKHVPSEAGAGGLIIGTPDYMAPELATGVEANVASDVYALGTILFEMLTGGRPFAGRSAIEVLKKKGAQEPPRADQGHPEIPRALAEVVARCMARRPEDRPESMRVLELDLMRSIDPASRAIGGSGSGGSVGSELPPPPEAGSLRIPAPSPSALAELPPATPSPARPAVVVGQAPAPTASSSPTPAPSPSLTASTSTSARVGSLPPPEVAAEKAGRSIVGIAVIGAAAAAVVLFVWPGVLRERGGDPEVVKDPGAAIAAAGVTAGEAGKAGTAVTPGGSGGGARLPPIAAGSGEASGGAGEAGGAASDGSGESGVEASGGEVDALIVAAKLELAVSEGRWRAPAGDNVAELLALLSAADPKHEGIKRARQQAAEVLLARGGIAATEKRWHDAVEHYRDLRAIWPDHKGLGKPFTEALLQDAKILRYIKDWGQMVEVAEDLIALNPRSVEAQVMRGEALEALGRWSDAAAAFKAAKALKPSDKAIADAIRRVETRAKAAGTG